MQGTLPTCHVTTPYLPDWRYLLVYANTYSSLTWHKLLPVAPLPFEARWGLTWWSQYLIHANTAKGFKVLWGVKKGVISKGANKMSNWETYWGSNEGSKKKKGGHREGNEVHVSTCCPAWYHHSHEQQADILQCHGTSLSTYQQPLHPVWHTFSIQKKKKACFVLLLNTALSLVLFILLPNHCCQCIFLGYMYSSLRAAYLVTFVLPLFYWSLTCLQHWSQWTFNTSCRFSLVQFCYVPGRSSYVALRFSRLFLAVIGILALQFFVSYIAEFCFRTMWCEHLFLLVYALMQGNRKRGLLSFVPFF